ATVAELPGGCKRAYRLAGVRALVYCQHSLHPVGPITDHALENTMRPNTSAPAEPRTTCIRNAAWLAAWDAGAQAHIYRRDVDVVFRGDRIVSVGSAHSGPDDETVDGRGLFVMPGLVDVHSHPTTEPGFKGIREEHGVPEMYMTGLYERVLAF